MDHQKVLDEDLFFALQIKTLKPDCRSITAVVARLVLQGANPLAKNELGKTALDLAVDNKRSVVLSLLIKLCDEGERDKARRPGGLKTLIDDVHSNYLYLETYEKMK